MGRPIEISPEAMRRRARSQSQADLSVVGSRKKTDLPDTPSDRLPKSSTDNSVEHALDVLLNHYVEQRDWFMAERLAHDLNRLTESVDKVSP